MIEPINLQSAGRLAEAMAREHYNLDLSECTTGMMTDLINILHVARRARVQRRVGLVN